MTHKEEHGKLNVLLKWTTKAHLYKATTQTHIYASQCHIMFLILGHFSRVVTGHANQIMVLKICHSF